MRLSITGGRSVAGAFETARFLLRAPSQAKAAEAWDHRGGPPTEGCVLTVVSARAARYGPSRAVLFG